LSAGDVDATTAPDTSAPAPKKDWRDPYTKIHPHHLPTAEDIATFGSRSRYVGREADNGLANIGAGGLGVIATFGSRSRYVGREAVKGVANIGAGGLQTILHPIDTAVGMGKLAYHAREAATGNSLDLGQDAYQMGRQFYDQPLETAETMVGQTAVLDAAGKVIPKVIKLGPRVAGKMVRSVTHTGPDVATDLAKSTEKINTVKEGRVAKLNERRAEVDAGRAKRVEDANKATEERVKGINERRAAADRERIAKAKADNDVAIREHEKTVAEADKKLRDAHIKYQAEKTNIENTNRAAEAIPDARQGLETYIKDKTSEADVLTEKARHDALGEGNKRYSGVNEKVGGVQADPVTVRNAIASASESLLGSTMDTTLLKNMEKAYRDEVPTYSDLQADYSRLGKELVKGDLPGDVYHAYDQLHEAIGDEMQRIADASGVGEDLKAARAYWRRMKQTFGKSSDTISDRAGKSVNEANPDYAAQQADEYRARLLGFFDPRIPTLLQDVAKALERLGKMPSEEAARKMKAEVPRAPEAAEVPPPATKSVPDPRLPLQPPPPKLPPAPRPPLPFEKKTIGAEDLTQANRESLAAKEKKSRTGYSPLLTAVSVFDAMRNALTGNWKAAGMDVATRGLYEVGKQGFAAALRNPKVIEFLSKPTAAQIEQIPPDLRGPSLKPFLDAAKKQGINVDPRLYVVAAGVAASQPKKRVAAALTPQ
jgi:hypothetical protein